MDFCPVDYNLNQRDIRDHEAGEAEAPEQNYEETMAIVSGLRAKRIAAMEAIDPNHPGLAIEWMWLKSETRHLAGQKGAV